MFHLRRVDHIRGILPVSVKQLLVSAVVAVFTVHPRSSIGPTALRHVNSAGVDVDIFFV